MDAGERSEGIIVRRIEPTDLPALGGLVDRARRDGEFRASSDPQAAFFMRSVEAGFNPLAVALSDAGLIGVVTPEFKVVIVEPSHRRRGIGRRLVEAAMTIERERGRSDLILGMLPDDGDGQAFLRATEFAYHSTLWDLDLPPDTPVPAPAWPATVIGRDFDRATDQTAFVRLFNAAFADHPTPMQIPDEAIDAPPEPGIVDADTFVLADRESGDLVGLCATAPERTADVIGPRAEIWAIGVRPDRQGQGLGRELLRWGVTRLRSIGVGEVHLSVNGRNERALGLYEREGFRRQSTRERWSRPVGPAGTSDRAAGR